MSNNPGFKTYVFTLESEKKDEVTVRVPMCLDTQSAFRRLRIMLHTVRNMGIDIHTEAEDFILTKVI